MKLKDRLKSIDEALGIIAGLLLCLCLQSCVGCNRDGFKEVYNVKVIGREL